MGQKENSFYLALFLTVAVVLSCLLGEALIRFASNYKSLYTIEMIKYADKLKIEDPQGKISRLQRPNANEKIMGVEIKLNSLGHRSPDIEPIKKAGVKRVLVMGSSETLGWGVEYNKTATTFLQNKLNQTASPATVYEVINAGVANYSVEDQNLLLQRQFEKVSPDVVILNYFFVDIVEKAPNYPIFKYSYLASYLYSFYMSLKANATHADFESLYSEYFVSSNPKWQKSLEQFKEISQFCKLHNVIFLVNLIPDMHDLSANSVFKKYYASVEQELLLRQVPTVSSFNLLSQNYGGREREVWVSPADPHPNGLAQETISDVLYSALKSR